MNRMRTQSSQHPAHKGDTDEVSRVSLAMNQPKIRASLVDSSIESQKKFVREKFIRVYHQEPKPLQVDTVVSLLNGENTFLLAGTGFGKTRIAETFYHLYKKGQKVIVLVLNPLDALGENQVSKMPKCTKKNTLIQTLTSYQGQREEIIRTQSN